MFIGILTKWRPEILANNFPLTKTVVGSCVLATEPQAETPTPTKQTTSGQHEILTHYSGNTFDCVANVGIIMKTSTLSHKNNNMVEYFSAISVFPFLFTSLRFLFIIFLLTDLFGFLFWQSFSLSSFIILVGVYFVLPFSR